jgi:tRNA isopentenyl-2-thiomethyl-A-37 hydroxylase MiaE
MQALIEAAPQLMDFLGAESLAHFDAVRAVLDAVGLQYRDQPAPGARHGLLQPHRVRVGDRSARRRRARSAAVGATTA